MPLPKPFWEQGYDAPQFQLPNFLTAPVMGQLEEAFGGKSFTPVEGATATDIKQRPLRGEQDYTVTRPTETDLGEYGSVWRDIQKLIQEGKDENRAARNEALRILMGEGGIASQLQGYFEPLIEQTQSALPLNPFTDEMVSNLLAATNDLITKQTVPAFNQAAINLASRGLSSGGTTSQTAAGGILGSALGARVAAQREIPQSQMEFNQAANLARQDLINKITGTLSTFLTPVQQQAASIRASDVYDPQMLSDQFGDVFGLQLAEQNQQQLLDEIAKLEPTQSEKLAEFLPYLATAFLPGAQNLQNLSYLPLLFAQSFKGDNKWP